MGGSPDVLNRILRAENRAVRTFHAAGPTLRGHDHEGLLEVVRAAHYHTVSELRGLIRRQGGTARTRPAHSRPWTALLGGAARLRSPASTARLLLSGERRVTRLYDAVLRIDGVAATHLEQWIVRTVFPRRYELERALVSLIEILS